MANTAEVNSKMHKLQTELRLKKKQELILEDEDKKNIVQEKFYGKNRDQDPRQINRDHKYFYKIFNKIGESLPEYMRKNLDTMPNNKGYIWRGCHFYGYLQEERNQPVILFEPKNRGLMWIHEIDSYEHRIYEKHNKDKKKLLSAKVRTVRKHRGIHVR